MVNNTELWEQAVGGNWSTTTRFIPCEKEFVENVRNELFDLKDKVVQKINKERKEVKKQSIEFEFEEISEGIEEQYKIIRSKYKNTPSADVLNDLQKLKSKLIFCNLDKSKGRMMVL